MRFSYDLGWLGNYVEYPQLFSQLKDAEIDTVAFNFLCLNAREELLDPEFYVQNAKRLREQLDEAGLCCNQALAPFSLKLCDERINRFEDGYGELVRALEFSSYLGAKQLVCCAVQTPDEPSALQKNIRIYRSLIPYCEKFNIKIAILSDFPKHIASSVLKKPWSNADEYAAFIGDCSSSWITACVDLGTEDAVEYLRRLGGNISATYFKDAKKYRDVHLPTFFKDADPCGLVRELIGVGYTGEFTLECPVFLKKYPNELLPAAFELMSKTARYICNEAEGAK